jgi:hypothetical protein
MEVLSMKKVWFKKLTATVCIMAMTIAMFTGCQKTEKVKETDAVTGEENKVKTVRRKNPLNL